jgi:hypothetical protein
MTTISTPLKSRLLIMKHSFNKLLVAIMCVYLINNIISLTDSMEQVLVDEPIVVQLVKNLFFFNKKVYSHDDKRPVHIPTLGQMNPVYSITPISLKFIATSFHQTLGLPSSSLGFPDHILYLCCMSPCITCYTCLILHELITNIWWY